MAAFAANSVGRPALEGGERTVLPLNRAGMITDRYRISVGLHPGMLMGWVNLAYITVLAIPLEYRIQGLYLSLQVLTGRALAPADLTTMGPALW